MSFSLGSRDMLCAAAMERERPMPSGSRMSSNAALEAAQYKCRQGRHGLPPGHLLWTRRLLVATATLREMWSRSWKHLLCCGWEAVGVNSDYEPPREGVELVQDMTAKCFIISSYKPKRRVSFEKCEHVWNCGTCFFSPFFLNVLLKNFPTGSVSLALIAGTWKSNLIRFSTCQWHVCFLRNFVLFILWGVLKVLDVLFNGYPK